MGHMSLINYCIELARKPSIDAISIGISIGGMDNSGIISPISTYCIFLIDMETCKSLAVVFVQV